MFADLQTTRQRIRSAQSDPATEMQRAIAVAESSRCQNVFLQPAFDTARVLAQDSRVGHRPLAGLAVSVKDLFDVAGQTTAAGSVALGSGPAASQDCAAVARLRQAGAVLIGRTNMSEFAFSGVGINPHFGTPINPCDDHVARIPGGSSSGAAVSVATAAAFVGLGSDTGGSIRIPAALTGIVGFKNTARLVPTTGAVPLSTTLDTVCALTRSVPDAIIVHEILAQRVVTRSQAPLSAYRLGIPQTLMLDALDPTVARAWQRTIARLHDAGARLETVAMPEIGELHGIQATGGFSAAESYMQHRRMLEKQAHACDPRVLARIMRGATMSACEYLELQQARRAWIGRMNTRMLGFDAFLSPTVPIVAPPIAELAPGAERDEAFFRVNALLLRNTSVINMLDGCAISIPCHRGEELPVGLMIWAGTMSDDLVLNSALQIEQLLQKQ